MTVPMTEQSMMSLRMHRLSAAAGKLVSLMNGVKPMSEVHQDFKYATERRRHDAAMKTLADLEEEGVLSFKTYLDENETNKI